MKPIQNADGHVGLTARNYPIDPGAAIRAGQVVKLSGGKAVLAVSAETDPILGIAAEDHSGRADALNERSNAPELMVCDNPGLLFECHAPGLTASGGSATTLTAAEGEVAAAFADDAFNGGTLLLVKKAEGSANTDPLGVRLPVTDYAKSGAVFTKPGGGVPGEGDVYELYPPVGSAICGLDEEAMSLVVSAGGATAIRIIGHDYDRHMLRCMAALHTLS